MLTDVSTLKWDANARWGSLIVMSHGHWLSGFDLCWVIFMFALIVMGKKKSTSNKIDKDRIEQQRFDA